MKPIILLSILILLSTACVLAIIYSLKNRDNRENKNIKIATKFFYTFYNDKDLVQARTMMSPDFINHHPYSGKGIDATVDAVNRHLFSKYPQFKVSIKRITADGDLVWIQSYTQNDSTDHGKMSMDIWRIKDGKIAEHWDIIQDIPLDIEPTSMYD